MAVGQRSLEGLGMNRTWKDRRVFVTGATGLVGSHLIRALVDAGAYTVALIRDWDPQSELIRSGTVQCIHVISGSLEDLSAVERGIGEHEADTVFHLGAQTIVGTAHRSPLATFEANIRGSYNVLEACRRCSATVRSIVVASSDKAYGDAPELPYTEDMPAAGRHPYDVSKSCTDLLAQSYAATYGLPAAVARCGNIYGGGDLNWSRLIPGTIRSLLRGEAPLIRSDGTFLRDYIYVEDVVSAYLRMAQWLDEGGIAGEAFNFSPERAVSVLQVVDLIRKLMDCEELTAVIRNEARGEIRDQYLSCAKAAAWLGWKAEYTFEEGLLRTIGWYREFFGVRAAAARA
jgi:CDP-glucose 4,6-dehydratase